MPAIYHEGSWLGNATDPEVLVKDTVGWTGKNRAYSQTNNAVIAHIENGITYDVSWTGSATVTLKKNSASGATITSGSTSPLSFTADADYELYFGSSATVTNIMVKDSRITDPTYEPYHESVEEEIEQIYTDNGVLGAKNLLPFPYYENGGASVTTKSGVTFTVNSDGTLTVNGTSTAITNFDFAFEFSNSNRLIYSLGKAKDGRFNGFITQGSTDIAVTGGDGSCEFQSNNAYRVHFVIYANKTFNNEVFKPMLRLASDPDDTYQPYAMTNRELTEKKVNKISTILSSTDDLDNIKTAGFYCWESSIPTNAPESLNYGTMIVNVNKENVNSVVHQIVVKGGVIYQRIFSGSPLAWKSWYKYTGTVVS